MAVAPGEKRRPRRRAERRDVKSVVAQTPLRDPRVVRGVDRAAERAWVAEARIVDEDQQDVGCAIRCLDVADRLPVRARAVERPVGDSVERRPSDRKLASVRLAHDLTSSVVACSESGAAITSRIVRPASRRPEHTLRALEEAPGRTAVGRDSDIARAAESARLCQAAIAERANGSPRRERDRDNPNREREADDQRERALRREGARSRLHGERTDDVDERHRNPDPRRPRRERPVGEGRNGDDHDPRAERESGRVVSHPGRVPQRPHDSRIRRRPVGDCHEERRAGTEDPGAGDCARQPGHREPAFLALGTPHQAIQALRRTSRAREDRRRSAGRSRGVDCGGRLRSA